MLLHCLTYHDNARARSEVAKGLGGLIESYSRGMWGWQGWSRFRLVEEAARTLVLALQDKDAWVRAWAAESLVDIQYREALPLIVDLCKQPLENRAVADRALHTLVENYRFFESSLYRGHSVWTEEDIALADECIKSMRTARAEGSE